MKWRVYGERLETADMSGQPRVFQPFTPPKTKLVKAFRTWFVYFNSPTLTDLTLRIYSNLNSLPGQLLWTSRTMWSGNAISSDAYAAKELFFDFDDQIKLRKGDTYLIAPYVSGYTGTKSSHLAWMRGFPDPNNTVDVYANQVNIARMPFYLGVIDGLRQ